MSALLAQYASPGRSLRDIAVDALCDWRRWPSMSARKFDELWTKAMWVAETGVAPTHPYIMYHASESLSDTIECMVTSTARALRIGLFAVNAERPFEISKGVWWDPEHRWVNSIKPDRPWLVARVPQHPRCELRLLLPDGGSIRFMDDWWVPAKWVLQSRWAPCLFDFKMHGGSGGWVFEGRLEWTPNDIPVQATEMFVWDGDGWLVATGPGLRSKPVEAHYRVEPTC